MFKYKNKFLYLFTVFLLLGQVVQSSDFVMRNTKDGSYVVIKESGDIFTSLEENTSATITQSPSDGFLYFRYADIDKMKLNNDQISVTGTIQTKHPHMKWYDYFDKNPIMFRHELDTHAMITGDFGSFLRQYDKDFNGGDISGGDQPNYIKTVVYFEPGKQKPVRATSFSDGLGKVIQTNSSMNSYTSIVSGTYFDEAGRAVRNTMAAPIVNTGSFVSMDNDAVVATEGSDGDKLSKYINDYYYRKYDNSNSFAEEMYPYSETVYEDDPLSRVKEVGAPGDDYRIKTTNSHTIKTWNFGVATATSFIENEITAANELTELEQKGHDTNAKYHLTVTRDPNGIYSQIIKDMAGNVVAKASHDDNSELITSSYEYDILGREIRKNPPSSEVPSDTTGYNALGQVTETWSPDKGLTEYTYNNDGSLNSVKKANNITVNYDYDNLGRVTKIYTDVGTHVRNYYHRIKNYLKDHNNGEFGANTDPHIETILTELTNIRGRIFLEVAHNELGDVIDVYSYDDEGRASASYTKIPGMAWVKTSYTYRLQGELEEKVITPQYLPAGSVKPIITRYKYDENNNALDTVKIVDNSGASEIERILATFEYDKMGKLVKKYLYDGKTDLLVATKEFQDNMQGWTTKIINRDEVGSKVAFQEDVFYNGMYDGTITSATYKYQPGDAMGKDYPLDYTYDKLKRLVAVEYKGSDAATFTDYNEAFAYDKNGRITQKVKGSLELNETPDFTDYVYKSITDYPGAAPVDPVAMKNNQLIQVKSKHSANNYSYDDNGNMISDVNKDLDITYDWRDMPTTMVLRDGAGATDDKGFTVKHVYNAKGNRVLKTSTRFTESEGIAYAGNGLVFRNNNLSANPENYNLLYANLGEVRFNYYEENVDTDEKDPLDSYGEAFFTLKDHLGSARAVLASNGDVVNQDWYYAYGEIENITSSGEIDDVTKVREQFTGKEFDEDGALVDDGLRGIDLFYFGARFYDAEVGYWVSTDPARQFFNLYSYGEPINSIDYDGRMKMYVMPKRKLGGGMYNDYMFKVDPAAKKTKQVATDKTVGVVTGLISKVGAIPGLLITAAKMSVTKLMYSETNVTSGNPLEQFSHDAKIVNELGDESFDKVMNAEDALNLVNKIGSIVGEKNMTGKAKEKILYDIKQSKGEDD